MNFLHVACIFAFLFLKSKEVNANCDAFTGKNLFMLNTKDPNIKKYSKITLLIWYWLVVITTLLASILSTQTILQSTLFFCFSTNSMSKVLNYYLKMLKEKFSHRMPFIVSLLLFSFLFRV